VRLSRGFRLSAKVQDYENYSFEVWASRSHHDYGLTDDELAALSDEERETIESKIREDISEELMSQARDEISHMQKICEPGSVVHSFLDPEKEQAPKRRRKRTR